ncbi:helix-turn-helix transcriptional regulator [Candidatus Lucifugimonas marina]|jgi:predicted ArsR family transcriptional regulator|uniref:MarR family transcriptional regulator n=1 Tax=Candidatus Lucifugimonas marina TaxID=3038979 RepID=A0AAJ5ZED9_9CHLR|nr:MarR family transcriptional regulator [SAR202 cluster bacterium JH702]MDG0869958.1 MarR family transcriptional regulator [SAR202 cluster bacterium JH639]WFG34681.1 MarR family transcriptional regulator [SAR202 cluster bacterium JH545]WFG38609.1 MarR family transcriptional regulator [SAR202 cluster bacterium JH1073]
MSVSRDNILTIIRQNNGVNVDELAKQMQLAPATVRRHLDILERDGLVDHSEVRKPTGRPQYSFHLTEKGHDSVPKDYSRLLNELVSEIKNIPAAEITSQSGDEVLRSSLSRIGERRAAEYLQGRRPVEAVTAAFEDGGYDPIVETNNDGLKIRVTNCPYRRASIDDDIICTVDRSMVNSLLGSEVEHSVEMSPEANECVYMLGAKHLVQIDSQVLSS